MKIKIDLTGEKELVAKLEKMGAELAGENLKAAVGKGADIIVKAAKEKAPVRTGKLKRSIDKEVEIKGKFKVVADIGPSKDAFYGLFQEKGTPKMAAHPFLRPAIDENKDAVETVIKNELRKRVLGL